ncbi:NPCBM/NEW2 domain-containing protein [Streptomyces lydicus]|uniref:Alpha-galactosidase n=1 Tax=Streptomyces lydicus TaxID=47763 RepID=A0A1D7VLY8_9ACTN|nr:NPCBM/NEW2 domain-containing protein [Streptomyces lydicus]AOP47760.1 alpha-galactosidase [Streptomyces lydicus]
MYKQFDTTGGTTPSDAELVRRIRAAARPGSRATAEAYGTPAPDGAAAAGEEALDEFHRRHYAAVLAYARSCSRTSQAAADLAKEAIDGVLYSQEPGEGVDAVWRDRLLAAVRHTAAAWHHNSRNTELRDNFESWLANQSGNGPDPSGSEREPATIVGEPSVAGPPPGVKPSGESRVARVSRLSPTRIAVLAVAVTALAGGAISAGTLLGPARHDASAGSPERSGHSSATTPDHPPTASPSGSATASGPASGSPSPTRTTASKHPSSRPSSSAKPSPSGRPGSEDTPSTARISPLVARPWTSSTNGWGPVGLNRSIDGHPLTIQGTSYTEGLGAHAPSEITYHLGGACSALSVDVGIDDEVGANGSVVFQIYRDGTKVADSGLMTVDQPAKHLTADLTGGSEMRLVVTDGGNGNNSDHADWAGPLITCR